MVRPPCCDKLNVKKGLWTEEEDAKILAYVSKHGTGNWTNVPKKAGLRRCGKSCRLRWTNYLRPDLKRESFTPQEEELIIRLHAAIGSRWSIIAQQLPGRTDNDVKNYWNTKLRKKLSEMGIDPVTHKPFSQILADYGNIGGLPKSRTRIGSLNRDMKNAYVSKPEPPYPTPAAIPPPAAAAAGMEPLIQVDNFFPTNSINHQAADSDSLDLLSQLQAIKLVTDQASNYTTAHQTISQPPQFPNEYNSLSSSSPSSSTCSTCSSAAQQQQSAAIAFSWRDFLLDDAFLPADHHDSQAQAVQEDDQHNVLEISSNNFDGCQTPVAALPKGHIDIDIDSASHNNNGNGGVQGVASYGFQASSSTDSSFVAAMLDQENEMFSEFANLLEDPCY